MSLERQADLTLSRTKHTTKVQIVLSDDPILDVGHKPDDTLITAQTLEGEDIIRSVTVNLDFEQIRALRWWLEKRILNIRNREYESARAAANKPAATE
jgi:hypothetical protein